MQVTISQLRYHTSHFPPCKLPTKHTHLCSLLGVIQVGGAATQHSGFSPEQMPMTPNLWAKPGMRPESELHTSLFSQLTSGKVQAIILLNVR